MFTEITPHISRITTPYKDIFTSVYAVDTEEGVLIFDSASYDSDLSDYITPFIEELGAADRIKYVFISHDHADHSGGIDAFVKKYPDAKVVSRSPRLKEKLCGSEVICSEDGDTLLGVLRVITIPGHTADSAAVFDTRTKTLITGDCLQLYGIYGSGNWGANISLIKEHTEAIEKLRGMDIDRIVTAHDYHPCGWDYVGKDAIAKALDSCIAPFDDIRSLISENGSLSDAEICAIYNNGDKPTLGCHVVTAVRKTM